MSDATFGSLMGLADDVAAYVRDVRIELADLPIEDVDDLTGGMEADLSELAAESGGDLLGRLGSPSLYAAELRAAAGLPERGARSRRRRWSWGDAMTRAGSWFTRLTERHPWLRPVTAFLVTLRPAWWVLRGYVVAWALWSMVLGGSRGLRPSSFKEFTVAVVLISLSVQIGRGWLSQRALSRPLLVVANASAAWLVLIALFSSGSPHYVETYSAPMGVALNGQQLVNIYAYDSDGNRITGVRLFDEQGRPLNGEEKYFDVNGAPKGVVRDSSGAPLINAYPRALVGPDPWQVNDPNAMPPPWTPPMTIVPLAPSTTATPTPTSTSTSTSITTPTSGATPSPSVTRSVR